MMSNLRLGTETGKWALRDATFLQLALYIVFNPVRAAIGQHLPSTVWSSYGSMIGVTMVAEYTGLRARIFCTNLLLRKITTVQSNWKRF